MGRAEQEIVFFLAGRSHWETFKDWQHVRLRQADHVGSVMSLQAIDAVLRERFGSWPYGLLRWAAGRRIIWVNLSPSP